MAMKGPKRKETHPRTKSKKPKSGRESIESFVVVFLCFLIWSLEAEGFVIPTGSMAPTLMGRHKEIACPECGYLYTVNADREIGPTAKENNAGRRIRSGTCENCRFEASVVDAPSFSGDRIYVMKDGLSLPFFGAPGRVKLKRWDVAVFKLPEEPEVRYIKRLVGMPNEVIRIDGGDLWVQPQDRSREFERLRRPPNHQEAMQLMVFDDRHRARRSPRIQGGCAGSLGRVATGCSPSLACIPRKTTPKTVGQNCDIITSSPARRNGKRFASVRHCRVHLFRP
jgi:signal peptidase I